MLIYPADLELDAPFHLPACTVVRLPDKRGRVVLRLTTETGEIVGIPVTTRRREKVRKKLESRGEPE